MAVELGFYVCVAEDAFFGVELSTVQTEEATVERDGWEEIERWWTIAGTGFDTGGGRCGEPAGGCAHGLTGR